MKKIPMVLNLHDWSPTLDYFQVTETINLIFLYKKNPEKVPKKFHPTINSWLDKKNLDKFIAYKKDSERHQMLLDKYSYLKQIVDN